MSRNSAVATSTRAGGITNESSWLQAGAATASVKNDSTLHRARQMIVLFLTRLRSIFLHPAAVVLWDSAESRIPGPNCNKLGSNNSVKSVETDMPPTIAAAMPR